MTPVHVLLSNMPALLRDIVMDALAGEPDIEVTGEARSGGELERLLGTARTDLVVAAEHDPDFARESRALLLSRAGPKLLVLSNGGTDAYLYWMKPETTALGELGPDALVREIRSAVSREPGH